MKKYLFNDSNVCINADRFGEIICTTGLARHQYISVACKPNGKWVFGVTYGFDHNGMGSFAPALDYEEYTTQRDAVIAGCKYIKNIADKQDRTHRETYSVSMDGERFAVDTCNNMRRCVELAYSQVNELTLF